MDDFAGTVSVASEQPGPGWNEEYVRAAPQKVAWQDTYFTSQDGLRLYARDYAKSGTRRNADVVCLAGLARTSRDFHELASRLAPNRRVVSPDYRGRGKSEYSDDWASYTPLQEMEDTLSLMTALGIHDAVIIGTSRGGLIAMLMAALRPGAIRAVILNDIGPEIMAQGLLRIRAYLGVSPGLETWADAAHFMHQINRGFDSLSEDEWMAWAKRTYIDRDGRPVGDYDIKLRKTFASHNDLTSGAIPTLWPQFNALKRVPLLVLRGQNSDILSPETVAKMKAEKPDLESVTVKNRGHVPFLNEPEALQAIAKLLEQADTIEH